MSAAETRLVTKLVTKLLTNMPTSARATNEARWWRLHRDEAAWLHSTSSR